MKSKLIIASIFAVMLILATTISSAGALDLSGSVVEESKEEVVEETVDEGCPLCADQVIAEEGDIELGGMAVNPPPGEEPPCYPCHEAVILGLADSKIDILEKFSTFPKISEYIPEYPEQNPGWIFVYINDIGEWLADEPGSLVLIIKNNLAKYNFSGVDIVGQAAIDAAAKVLEALQNYKAQYENGTITLPMFVLVASIPVLVAIFTTYFTVSLFLYCLGNLIGGGTVGVTQLPAALPSETTEVLGATEATESTTSGTMSL